MPEIKKIRAQKLKEGKNLTSKVDSVLGLLLIEDEGENGRSEDTFTACDNDSTQMWVDNKILDKLKITGELNSFNVTGIDATPLTTCKLAQAKIWPANSTEKSCRQLTVNIQDSRQVGESVFDLREMKKSYA